MAGENDLSRSYGKKIKLKEVQQDFNIGTCRNDVLMTMKDNALKMFKYKTSNSFEKQGK